MWLDREACGPSSVRSQWGRICFVGLLWFLDGYYCEVVFATVLELAAFHMHGSNPWLVHLVICLLIPGNHLSLLSGHHFDFQTLQGLTHSSVHPLPQWPSPYAQILGFLLLHGDPSWKVPQQILKLHFGSFLEPVETFRSLPCMESWGIHKRVTIGPLSRMLSLLTCLSSQEFPVKITHTPNYSSFNFSLI